MADKILVADDSLTIQKVVAITLANEPWVLVEATDESELLGKVRGGDFKLALVDFNLSESKSGYELAAEIKKIAPNTAVLALLGTFDSVDEQKLMQSGYDGKIVKPFDSHKFIQKCRELIEQGGGSTLSEAEEASLDFESDIGEEWVMDAPQNNEENESDTWDEDTSPGFSVNEQINSNDLESELEGWGVSVPDPIGAHPQTDVDMLPVIEESDSSTDISFEENTNSVEIQLANTDDDTVYPDNNELDYPDFGASGAKTSSLIALDQLAGDDEEEEGIVFETEGPREELAREIESELSPDDFWAVDEGDSNQAISLNMDHDDESDDDFVVGVGDPQAPVEPIKPSQSSTYTLEPKAAPAFDEDRIVEKIKASLAPMLEEIVRKYMNEKVEKVAWEIIPDVAENLIRKEIKELANSSRNS